MKIKHDGEYFENMIQSLKEIHEDIEDLDFKISDMWIVYTIVSVFLKRKTQKNVYFDILL